MPHRYPRTERDLRALAFNFSAGNIVRGLPERLECLAASYRLVVEAEKAAKGEPHTYDVADREYALSIRRLHDAGVDYAEGEYTLSPCMGPDAAQAPRLSERARVARNHAYAAVLVAAQHSAAGRMGHAHGLRLMAGDSLADMTRERGGPLPWSHAASARLLARRTAAKGVGA